MNKNMQYSGRTTPTFCLLIVKMFLAKIVVYLSLYRKHHPHLKIYWFKSHKFVKLDKNSCSSAHFLLAKIWWNRAKGNRISKQSSVDRFDLHMILSCDLAYIKHSPKDINEPMFYRPNIATVQIISCRLTSTDSYTSIFPFAYIKTIFDIGKTCSQNCTHFHFQTNNAYLSHLKAVNQTAFVAMVTPKN